MKRILLVADAGGEIGWGHAMRTLAVAEELVQRSGVQAVWVTNTPREVHSLKPPVPVSERGLPGDVWLLDIGKSYPHPLPSDVAVWNMIDHGVGVEGTNRICPHFGAEERDWGPGAVVCGPRWMPLRKELVGYPLELGHPPEYYPRDGYDAEEQVLAYRGPGGIPRAHDLSGGEVWWERKWSRAIVPPSTIAYECMALGIPVSLVPLPNDQPRDVGAAMVKAGVARWFGTGAKRPVVPMAEAARAAVDGLGASRIADLLERW